MDPANLADSPSETTQHVQHTGPKENYVVLLLRRMPRWRLPALGLAVLGILFGLGGMGVVWIYTIPSIWRWGIAGPLADPLPWEWLKLIPGAFALLMVSGLSVWLPGLPVLLAAQVLRVYAEATESEVTRQVDRLSIEQSAAERLLEDSDRTGLIPLVRYSRMQLEAYYKIGLSQTQRSFRYSLIAMWIGFVVILAGLVYQVLPLEHLFPSKTATSKADITVVAVAGSAIIEIVAALFLWVYRSSIVQLTYFYNRQMHIHNVVMCYRMASVMKEPDSTVHSIIEKVLEQTWAVERPGAPSGRVLGEMFAKSGSKSAT